jgi:hypothetical protein
MMGKSSGFSNSSSKIGVVHIQDQLCDSRRRVGWLANTSRTAVISHLQGDEYH